MVGTYERRPLGETDEENGQNGLSRSGGEDDDALFAIGAPGVPSLGLKRSRCDGALDRQIDGGKGFGLIFERDVRVPESEDEFAIAPSRAPVTESAGIPRHAWKRCLEVAGQPRQHQRAFVEREDRGLHSDSM